MSGENAQPVIELTEKGLYEIALAAFRAIMRNKNAAIALGRNDHFNTCCGKSRADVICIVALVGEK